MSPFVLEAWWLRDPLGTFPKWPACEVCARARACSPHPTFTWSLSPHSYSIMRARLFSMSLTSNAKSMSFTNTCHIGRLYFTIQNVWWPGLVVAHCRRRAWPGPAFLSRAAPRLTLINQLRWHTSDPAKFLNSAELSFRPPLSYIFLQKLISIVVRRAAAAGTIVTQVARLCGGGALADGGAAIQLASPVQRILGFRLSRHVGLHASCLGQNSKDNSS